MQVIVAEDGPLVRQLLAHAVQALGHECVAVEDGLAAYAHYREHGGDLIISDWSMPGLDGLELCRRIRSIPQDGYAYFILLTAHGGEDNLLDAMRAGVDDFVTKPLDPVILEARLIAAERVTSLYRERQAHTARLETLLRASRRFAFEAHPDQLLPGVLAEAIDLLGADEGEIACWDDQQHDFVRVHRVSAAGGHRPLRDLADTSYRLNGLTGSVTIEDRPDEHGRWSIVASMLQGRHLLGTIRLISSDPNRRFEQADADILEMVAAVAAASLVGTERSRLEGVLLAGRTMSHELNNKLALTVGYVDMIGNDPRLPPDLRAEALLAIEASNDASALLQQLTKLTRIEEVDWGGPSGPTIDLRRSTSQPGDGSRRAGP
mgnify:CR=1 FL=1